MNQVEITINRRSYTITCNPGEEDRIIMLAGHVDAKVSELKSNASNVGDTYLLMMAGLLLANDLVELRENRSSVAVEMATRTQDSNDAEGDVSHVINALTERLDQLVHKLDQHKQSSASEG